MIVNKRRPWLAWQRIVLWCLNLLSWWLFMDHVFHWFSAFELFCCHLFHVFLVVYYLRTFLSKLVFFLFGVGIVFIIRPILFDRCLVQFSQIVILICLFLFLSRRHFFFSCRRFLLLLRLNYWYLYGWIKRLILMLLRHFSGFSWWVPLSVFALISYLSSFHFLSVLLFLCQLWITIIFIHSTVLTNIGSNSFSPTFLSNFLLLPSIDLRWFRSRVVISPVFFLLFFHHTVSSRLLRNTGLFSLHELLLLLFLF